MGVIQKDTESAQAYRRGKTAALGKLTKLGVTGRYGWKQNYCAFKALLAMHAPRKRASPVRFWMKA